MNRRVWLLLCLVLLGTLVVGGWKERPKAVMGGKVQSYIWTYENSTVQPPEALVVELERKQWQALVAACLAPAFYHRGGSTPLLFDDGGKKRSIGIPHQTIKVSSLGANAPEATARIAQKYWQKAEIVFMVDSYEQALWVVPSASFLSAPILVKPKKSLLRDLEVKCAIVVGSARPKVDEVVTLSTKEEVWRFQLELFNTNEKVCNYLVLTNPHDTDNGLNPNIQWPYLSLAAAPLAAYRGAMVQTGDYTGNREKLHALGGALGRKEDKACYHFMKPIFQKIKDASYEAERFMMAQGHRPEYLGLVGGVIALPMYVCDIHTKYKYWGVEVHYVPSDLPYGVVKKNVGFTRFIKPELAPGRIIADDILGATLLLTRTFFYSEFLPGGRYTSLSPSGWQEKALILDGHRLNQPEEGGPPASPKEPFYPAKEIKAAFSQAGYKVDYLVPRDVTNPEDTNPPIEQLLQKSGEYSLIQFVAHGDPPYIRIEIGKKGQESHNYQATGPKIRGLMGFAAPSMVYIIGCHTGTLYASFAGNESYLPTSFVHIGAVALIAPHTCQSVCFWRYAPKGPASIQTVYFWENALSKGMPIGKALVEAKWKAYQQWKQKQFEPQRGDDSDNAIEPDAPTVLLFGDPALRIGEGKRE